MTRAEFPGVLAAYCLIVTVGALAFRAWDAAVAFGVPAVLFIAAGLWFRHREHPR